MTPSIPGLKNNPFIQNDRKKNPPKQLYTPVVEQLNVNLVETKPVDKKPKRTNSFVQKLFGKNKDKTSGSQTPTLAKRKVTIDESSNEKLPKIEEDGQFVPLKLKKRSKSTPTLTPTLGKVKKVDTKKIDDPNQKDLSTKISNLELENSIGKKSIQVRSIDINPENKGGDPFHPESVFKGQQDVRTVLFLRNSRAFDTGELNTFILDDRPMDKGGSKEVYHSFNPKTNEERVFYRPTSKIRPKDFKKDIKKQKKITKDLKERGVEGIVRMNYRYTQGGTIWPYSDYYNQGSLENFVATTLKEYSEEEAKLIKIGILKSLAEILRDIHEAKYRHRDVKALNVLIHQDENEGITVGFADFEFTRNVNYFNLPSTPVGTIDHLAPELCQGKKYKVYGASDVYAFGILIWTLFEKDDLFEYPLDKNGEVTELVQKYPLVVQQAQEKVKARGSQKKTGEEQALYDLIRDCMNFETKDRPKMPEVTRRINTIYSQMMPVGELELVEDWKPSPGFGVKTEKNNHNN